MSNILDMSSSASGSSELSTLKVLTRGAACLSCRRRKQRCGGSRPVCQQCIHYRRADQCIYDEKPKSQIEVLEDRVKHLEEMLARVSQSRSPTINTLGIASEGSSQQLAPIPREISLPRPHIILSPGTRAEVASELRIPPEVTDSLLTVFFAHLYQFNFSIDIAKFRESLLLSSEDSRSPHPALISAMCLLGSHFSEDSDARRYEAAFNARAQRHLDDSLAHVDRLLDFLLATTLLAQYNLIKGNLAKGSYLASSAMSFAVGCGLHHIDVHGGVSYDTTLLPPPSDALELVERINVFGSVFQIDRLASLESGLPVSLIDQQITTPLPQTLRHLNQGGPFIISDLTISSLYSENSSAASVHGDTVLAVRAKATALLDRSTRQARHATAVSLDGDPDFWDSFNTLDLALVRFRQSLPPVNASLSDQNTVIDDETEAAWLHGILPFSDHYLSYTLAFAHVSATAAVIQLHGLFARIDQSESAIVTRAAHDIVGYVRALGDLNPRRMHMSIGIGIAAAARVLIGERRRLREPEPGDVVIQDLNLGIETLVRALRTLASFYPGLHLYLEDVEKLHT